MFNFFKKKQTTPKPIEVPVVKTEEQPPVIEDYDILYEKLEDNLLKACDKGDWKEITNELHELFRYKPKAYSEFKPHNIYFETLKRVSLENNNKAFVCLLSKDNVEFVYNNNIYPAWYKMSYVRVHYAYFISFLLTNKKDKHLVYMLKRKRFHGEIDVLTIKGRNGGEFLPEYTSQENYNYLIDIQNRSGYVIFDVLRGLILGLIKNDEYEKVKSLIIKHFKTIIKENEVFFGYLYSFEKALEKRDYEFLDVLTKPEMMKLAIEKEKFCKTYEPLQIAFQKNDIELASYFLKKGFTDVDWYQSTEEKEFMTKVKNLS